jgi:hypothetical protein
MLASPKKSVDSGIVVGSSNVLPLAAETLAVSQKRLKIEIESGIDDHTSLQNKGITSYHRLLPKLSF